MKKILVIDDDTNTLRTLSLIFSKNGYEVETAETGTQALRMVKVKYYDLVLLDLILSDLSGLDLIEPIKKIQPTCEVIIVTGNASLGSSIEAISRGATGYLVKPLDLDDVLFRIKIISEKQDLVLEKIDAKRILQLKVDQLKNAVEGIINVLASTIEVKDPYTAGHQRRVTFIADAIGKDLHLSKNIREGLHMAATIHDIGKIFVPTEILSKPGPLNYEEYALLKKHPDLGSEILKDVDLPWPISEIIRQHHERLDGSGYPLGLTERNIRIEAKILAVADVVEAMSSHRPYRPSLGTDAALNEINKKKGILYDRDVVCSCLKLFEKKAVTLENITWAGI